MILKGNSLDIRKAILNIFKNEYRKKYPDLPSRIIHKLAVKKFNRYVDHLPEISGFLLASLLAVGTIMGQHALNPQNNSEEKMFSIDYLTDEQRAFIDSLDGAKLEEYIQSFDISARPDSLQSTSESSRAKEAHDNSNYYYTIDREFHNGLRPFLLSVQLYPDKYTEGQLQHALGIANDSMGRLAKNCVIDKMLENNQLHPDKQIYSIPDPGDVNFKVTDGLNNTLAETYYDENGGLRTKQCLYTESTFKNNGIDDSIYVFVSNLDYLDSLEEQTNESSNNPRNMKKTIDRIINLEEVVENLCHTEIVAEKHWFNPDVTYDFYYTATPQLEAAYEEQNAILNNNDTKDYMDLLNETPQEQSIDDEPEK